jgi:hypothetical protein
MKQGPPRHAAIVHYWAEQGVFPVNPCRPECFACREGVRLWSKLERCHITAASALGSFEPSNFILLCAQCHREAPMTTDREILIRWVLEHESWGSIFYREIKAGTDMVNTPEEFMSEDGPRFSRFMDSRKFDCHPRATRAERIKNIGLMMREYLALKKIFS